MTYPLTDLTAAAHRSMRAPGDRHWNDLAADEQATLKSYHRACLDYVAGGDGLGVIYSLGPGDPPPTSPPT